MGFFAFCLFFSLAHANVLSEETLRKSVLAHFPLIEEANLKISAAKGDVTSSKGAFDTKIKYKHRNHVEALYENQFSEISIQKDTSFYGLKLEAGHRQGNGLFAPYEGKYDTSAAGELFAGLIFPILKNRSIDDSRNDLKFSQIDKKIAESELLIKKNYYTYKGLSLYQKWRMVHKKIGTLKELLTLALDRQTMLQKRLSAGDVEHIKLTDNQRSILKRKDELLSAQMELAKWAAQLSLYYRDDNSKVIDLSDYKPSPDFLIENQKIGPIQTTRLPQLKVLDLEMEKNRAQIELSENEKLPELNVQAQALRELSGNYPYDPQKVYLGVFFQYPLENRKGTGKTVSSTYKTMALEKRRQWLENEFLTLFNQSQQMATLANERNKTIGQELENSKLLSQAERKRWGRGDSDLFIVALREQDAADVEIKLWKAQYELAQTVLDAKLYSSILVAEKD